MEGLRILACLIAGLMITTTAAEKAYYSPHSQANEGISKLIGSVGKTIQSAISLSLNKHGAKPAEYSGGSDYPSNPHSSHGYPYNPYHQPYGCKAGYRPGGKGDCIDDDECRKGSVAACGVNADCINRIGSFSCVCLSGYAKDKYGKCTVNVNECLYGKAICSKNENCVDIHGGYACHCKPGFYHDRKKGCIPSYQPYPPYGYDHYQGGGERYPTYGGDSHEGGYSDDSDEYPPKGDSYPPKGDSYPPKGDSYPPKGDSYPPKGDSYPPKGDSYPPYDSHAPPKDGYYPPNGPYYPENGGYYPQTGGHPPQNGGYYPPPQGDYPPPKDVYPPKDDTYAPPKDVYPPKDDTYAPPKDVYPPKDDQKGGYLNEPAYPEESSGKASDPYKDIGGGYFDLLKTYRPPYEKPTTAKPKDSYIRPESGF